MNFPSTDVGLQQWLVEFENKTQVLNLPVANAAANEDEAWKQSLLQHWSFRTGWPEASLRIRCIAEPYISIRVVSSLRGGKGGFGTLLKGQSRQAGAKLTTDFGACRDLQGRRLRHVNDEIKLRKWREAQQIREQGGDDKEATAVMFDTPSGLYNWHLMVPSWADISKKSSRKIQRQFQRLQREEDKAEKARQEKRAQYERSVTMYVNKATDASKQAKSNIKSAVQQGLQAQKEKKRKLQEQEEESPADLFQETDRPNSLCTLSGDVVIEESKKGARQEIFQIQSLSDFATLALFLDRTLKSTDNKSASLLYYEVKLVTGGLAQIGWADMTSQDFHPNTEEGEGVGDDKGSYGYDGSRALKFHGGEEEVYEDSKWKAGDVVGCQYNLQTGEISYSLNGKELGVAFTVPSVGTMLFPALSSNGGEILELHIGPQQMEYLPKSKKSLVVIPVQELVAASIADKSTGKEETGDDNEQKPKAMEETIDEKPEAPANAEEKKEEQTKEPEKRKEPVKVEPLNLDQFDSIEDLEELGLDRLKGALMAIDVKCGGDLKQRAARLFSLKGLERKVYPAKVRAKNFRP